MNLKTSSRLTAILQALLVTFLWSTSFIIIKIGLAEIPPLTFAGLRYVLAFICLFPFAFTKTNLEEIKKLNRKDWAKLVLLGLFFYTFTQGAQFVGLSLLPAVTVSLILNFTPVIVAVMAIFLLAEYPSKIQWTGAFLFIAGIIIYFFPVDLPYERWLGLLIMIVGALVNAVSAVLGRNINRTAHIKPLIVTIISMGIGSVIMLATGLAVQGLTAISALNVFYLIWLAAVNTAFAFTLWNHTLRTLTAMESSIINGTMLIQIAVLAWIFLGEDISLKETAGMVVAAFGALLVQIRVKKLKS